MKKKKKNRSEKGNWRQETTSPATAHIEHVPPPGTSSATNNHRKTPKPPKNHQSCPGRQVVTHTRRSKEWPPWRVLATRRAGRTDTAMAGGCWTERRRWPPWRGACLRKSNRSKQIWLQRKAKKSRSKTSSETHQKVAPQLKSCEIFYQGTSTTTGSNPGRTKLNCPNI